MPWSQDDSLETKAKRAVGRPVENPFLSPEIEEDFVRRGEAMLKLYYKEGGPNHKEGGPNCKEGGPGTRHNFVFGPDRVMSKTLFWSIIFVYYHTQKQLRNNVQGYLNTILLHFDPKVVSDRTSLCQSVGLLNRLTAYLTLGSELVGADGRAQKEYRAKYQLVVKLWKEVTAS